MSEHVSSFGTDKEVYPVVFNDTLVVKEGVECDTYSFTGDSLRDLAIIRVQRGYATPLQRVLRGDQTVEGFIDGEGTLTVQSPDGKVQEYKFTLGDPSQAIKVSKGQLMQWHADGSSNLTAYEICYPPFEDGRFENLAESGSG